MQATRVIAGWMVLGTTAMLPPSGSSLLAEEGEVPAKSPVTAIGVANSVTLAGKRLRLASIRDTERDRVRDFVPAGETAAKWSARYSQREFFQAISPTKYANAVADLTASQGGKVISAVVGPGEAASIALVLHSLVLPASEVSVWRFFIREGRLICLQYTERIEGGDHAAAAERLAKEKAADWLRELQVQRPWAGLDDALAETAAAGDEPE